MKTYVLMISRTFPATHSRKGEDTGFTDSILGAGTDISPYRKIHTIRSNYELWKKRIDKVQSGDAELSLRYWSGKPYKSKQVEFLRIGKDDGVGIQKVEFRYADLCYPIVNNQVDNDNVFPVLHENDGLNWQDFKDWFKSYDLSKPMAIIHFTKFRY